MLSRAMHEVVDNSGRLTADSIFESVERFKNLSQSLVPVYRRSKFDRGDLSKPLRGSGRGILSGPRIALDTHNLPAKRLWQMVENLRAGRTLDSSPTPFPTTTYGEQ